MDKNISFLYKRPVVIITILCGIIGVLLFAWLFVENIDSSNVLLKWGIIAVFIMFLSSLILGIKRAVIGYKSKQN